jgi:hypothetical protein
MSGSLGGGRSKSYQQQQSSSYGYSGSQQASTSTQDVFQGDIFARLYGNASDAAGGAAVGAGALRTAAQQLFTGGNQFLEQLGGDAGSAYLEDRLTANNPVLEQQISQLQQDTGRLFREELNPAITSRTVSGGTFGGGRQGVAQGLAAESAARVFTQGATALRAGDIASRDAVAQSIATNSLNAASTGLGALPSLLEILERGNSAELGVYGQLSNVLGGPTTLTTAQSLAKAFGEQSSQSSGYGRSSSWNFDTSASFFPTG